MHFESIHYARDEAIRLVQNLIKDLGAEETLCTEMPFLNVRRKADIALLSPSRLAAFEIKGPRDNIQSLSEQIQDYQRMFLEVTVAASPNNISKARELLPDAVGIILLGEDELRILRKPKRVKILPPSSAAAWLGARDLGRLIGSTKARAMGIEKARDYAAQSLKPRDLSAYALRVVAERNTQRFAAFWREKGGEIDLDDLQMLSLQQNIRR